MHTILHYLQFHINLNYQCKFVIMAKAKSKPTKKRAENYDTKLAINGTFEDVIKLSVAGNPAPAPKPVKPSKKK